MMEIGYDAAKRDKPLKERGLDFEDIRKDYDERRWVTIGFLSGRMVVVGCPPPEPDSESFLNEESQ